MVERLVFVHGSVRNGDAAWAAQHKLSDRYELVVAAPRLDALVAARYPKLVVSGGWSRGFDAVCDVLEERLGAERAVLSGAGHNPQLATGFNERLVDFLTSSGARSPR